eukprot:Hpha_TRINITY_DN3665_c0_g1::TRINITY_DN3665_c0_g1_i1::g.1109::m.1109
MDCLVREVRRYLEEQAMNKLKVLWLPRIRLILGRSRRKMAVARASVDERVEVMRILKESALTSSLAPEPLERLFWLGHPATLAPGRPLVHQGEPPASGIWIIVDGSVAAIHRDQKEVCKEVCRYTAPCVLGELAVLTGENWNVSLRAVGGPIRVWSIPSEMLNSELRASLPSSRLNEIYDVAFRQREDMLRDTAPLAPSDLRKVRLFDKLTDAEILQFIARLKPRCYRTGAAVCTVWEAATQVLFLKCGTADSTAPHQPSVILHPGECIGDMTYVFGRRRRATVVCRSHCDVWSLSYDDLDAVLARGGDMRTRINAAAQESRREMLECERHLPGTLALLSQCLRRSAVVGESCPDEALHEMSKALQPSVHMPGQVVVSSVSPCDRLLVVTQGRLRLQQGVVADIGCVEHGDVVGFTCGAVHRWLFAMVALSGCDVWSLPRNRMCAIAARHGALGRLMILSRIRLTSEVYRAIPEVLGRREAISTWDMVGAAAACPSPSLDEDAAGPEERALALERLSALGNDTEPPLLHPMPSLPASCNSLVQSLQPPEGAWRLFRRLHSDGHSSPTRRRRRRRRKKRSADQCPRRSELCWIVDNVAAREAAAKAARRGHPAKPKRPNAPAPPPAAVAAKAAKAVTSPPQAPCRVPSVPPPLSRNPTVCTSDMFLSCESTVFREEFSEHQDLQTSEDETEMDLEELRSRCISALSMSSGMAPLPPAPPASSVRGKGKRPGRGGASALVLTKPPQRLRPKTARHALADRRGLEPSGVIARMGVQLPLSPRRWHRPPGNPVHWGPPKEPGRRYRPFLRRHTISELERRMADCDS